MDLGQDKDLSDLVLGDFYSKGDLEGRGLSLVRFHAGWSLFEDGIKGVYFFRHVSLRKLKLHFCYDRFMNYRDSDLSQGVYDASRD